MDLNAKHKCHINTVDSCVLKLYLVVEIKIIASSNMVIKYKEELFKRIIF